MFDKIGIPSTGCSTRHMTGLSQVKKTQYFCIVERTKDLTTELFDIADTTDTLGRPRRRNEHGFIGLNGLKN